MTDEKPRLVQSARPGGASQLSTGWHPHRAIGGMDPQGTFGPHPVLRPPDAVEPHPVLRIYLFGFLRVYRGEQVALDENSTRRKVKALFTYLYLKRGRRVSKEELLDRLWPLVEQPGAGRLKQTVLELRSAIEPPRPTGLGWRYILQSGGFYYFNTNADYHSDVEEFERELALAHTCEQRHEPDCALAHYERAFELRREEFLPDFRYHEWALSERSRLHELSLQALEDAAHLYGSRREYGRAVALLRRAVREDPLRESSYLGLMRCTWLDGKRAEALRVYHHLHDVLAAKLQVEPGPEVTRLYEAIRHDRAAAGEARR